MSAITIPGATYSGNDRTRFVLWAPFRNMAEIHLTRPVDRVIPMNKDESGYFQVMASGVPAGSRYFYRLDGDAEYPDPASRFQPEGVHGPSLVVDPEFDWNDSDWRGLPLQEYIIYELHTGTFTSEGTFDAIIGHLDRLGELGITALELMPIAQFPGNRNWGYDGVYPFAVQNSYGGPDGLKRLVNACHRRRIAVVLDVVYNHLGPEGNYMTEFGPYFTDKYHTPWGDALNFDDAYSDDVRRFFIENAFYWLTEFHIDALRLDALHAILDISSFTFIEELTASVKQRAEKLKRNIYLIGESTANNARLISPHEAGGYELDAQWNDDFHHSLHVLLTGEKTGYYQDFGTIQQMAKALQEGFVYTGKYSLYRKHRHGTSSKDIPAQRFVVFSQNHDQVGNRAGSDRLSGMISFEALKFAAGIVMLSPYLPLVFMGEEYGELAPFPYFISHSEPDLIEAVRRGRKEEFASFDWQGEIRDPQDEATFSAARLNHELRKDGWHEVLYYFYLELIRIRKKNPVLSRMTKDGMVVRVNEDNRMLSIYRHYKGMEIITICNFNDSLVEAKQQFTQGRWRKLLDSSETRWLGAGSSIATNVESKGEIIISVLPKSFVVFEKEN